MKKQVSVRVLLSKVFLFLLIICVYVRSGSPYSLTYQRETVLLHILLSAILFLEYFITTSYKRIPLSLVFLVAIFFISLFISILIANELSSYVNYVIQILMCIDAILIVMKLGIEKTIRLWILSMRTVTIAAIILYVMIMLGIRIVPRLTTNTASYYTILFASQLTNLNRASGSFWEPSMFVFFLTFTLLFELMIFRESGFRNRGWIITEILAMILTYSASAVVGMVLVGFIYYYGKSIQKKTSILFMCVVLFLSLAFIIFFDAAVMLLYKAFPTFFYKFVEKDISFLTRINNPIGDIMTCVNYPFGVGVQNVEIFVRQFAALITGDARAVISRTSTWSYYFAAFGWGAGISVNMIWIIGVLKCRWLSGIQKLVLAVLIFYMLTSITLVTNQLYWILIVLFHLSASRSQLDVNEIVF